MAFQSRMDMDTAEKLERFLPLRVVLRKEGESLKGIVEHSFSMDTSDQYVRIWWSGKAYSMMGEHQLDANDDAKHNARPGDLVLNPLDKDCPIEIDWEFWLTCSNKFQKRNGRFRMKEKYVQNS